MKYLIALLILCASIQLSAQKYFVYETNTLTNVESETVTLHKNLTSNSLYLTIYTQETVLTGTATGTITLEGSIDNVNWYPVLTGTATTALSAVQTITAAGETWYTVPSVGGAATYGSAQYRYLRAVIDQTGTGTSTYHTQFVWKN